ncbi:adenylate kinase 7 [Biomphalaria glabrata]|nr:adenylate kinase 7 [Biomphalaria glabrata]
MGASMITLSFDSFVTGSSPCFVGIKASSLMVSPRQLLRPGICLEVKKKVKGEARNYNKRIMPEFVICLEATDDFLKNRVMTLPESVVNGTQNIEKKNSSGVSWSTGLRTQKKSKERKEKRKKKARREAEELQERRRRQEGWSTRLNDMKREECELLEAQSYPLRNYLVKHVMPTLTQALIDCCKTRSYDPMDYLAEYLIQHNPQID